MHTHIHTQLNNSKSPHLEVGILAGEAPLSVHQSQEDKGEVRAWQIQGIIRPLSSLQLSLTRLVGEDEGDRREFMTYPCNHRGGLRQSEIKHMGTKRKKMKKDMRQEKNGKIFLWRWESKWSKVERERNADRRLQYILLLLSFDCHKNHSRLADIGWFPLKTQKCFIFVRLPFKNDQR